MDRRCVGLVAYIVEYGREAVGLSDDLVEPTGWQPWRDLTLNSGRLLLRDVAALINLRMIRESPRGPKTPVPPRTRFKNKPRVSTKKLLDQAERDL